MYEILLLKASPDTSSDDTVSSGFLAHSTLEESQAAKKTPTPAKQHRKSKHPTARKSTAPPVDPQKTPVTTPRSKKTVPIPSSHPRRSGGLVTPDPRYEEI